MLWRCRFLAASGLVALLSSVLFRQAIVHSLGNGTPLSKLVIESRELATIKPITGQHPCPLVDLSCATAGDQSCRCCCVPSLLSSHGDHPWTSLPHRIVASSHRSGGRSWLSGSRVAMLCRSCARRSSHVKQPTKSSSSNERYRCVRDAGPRRVSSRSPFHR
jgi:hypothetical protein